MNKRVILGAVHTHTHTSNFIDNKKGCKAFSLDIKNKLLAMCNICMAKQLVFCACQNFSCIFINFIIIQLGKIYKVEK